MSVGPASLAKYDISGVCPRSAVTQAWPCDVPNDSRRNNPAIQPTELFSVSFERLGGGDSPDNHVSENERHFEWAWWFLGDFKQYALDAANPDDKVLNAGMNYLASLCFAADVQMRSFLFNDVPLKNTYAATGRDSLVDQAAPECRGEQLVASKYTAFFTGVHDRAGAHSEAVESLMKDIGFGGGHWRQRQNNAPYGHHDFLDTLCGCRWQVCGQGSHAGVPADAVAFTRELCSRTFTTPLTSRRYAYRPPALNPHFGKDDFEETYRTSHLAELELGIAGGPHGK